MKLPIIAALPVLAFCGEIVWDGRINASTTVDHFDQWSWSNQLEPYQWYIHGNGDTSRYLALSPEFKNPASNDGKGIKISIDKSSSWNGQPMLRSELIPQTSADLGSGRLVYHFSLQTRKKNAPGGDIEHQIAFFESHFTELQYKGNTLHWMADGTSHWSTKLQPGTWYNFAYDIDFEKQTVGLWTSTAGQPLKKVGKSVSASASSNSQDWHVGELKTQTAAGKEDWYWSGVYIERAPVTTNFS